MQPLRYWITMPLRWLHSGLLSDRVPWRELQVIITRPQLNSSTPEKASGPSASQLKLRVFRTWRPVRCGPAFRRSPQCPQWCLLWRIRSDSVLYRHYLPARSCSQPHPPHRRRSFLHRHHFTCRQPMETRCSIYKQFCRRCLPISIVSRTRSPLNLLCLLQTLRLQNWLGREMLSKRLWASYMTLPAPMIYRITRRTPQRRESSANHFLTRKTAYLLKVFKI